jgi:lysozyme
MIDPSIDPRLARDLTDAEGDKLTAYQDTEGYWTIGRGHLLPKPHTGQSWEGFTIAQDVSDRYFNSDVLTATVYARALPEFASCDTPARVNALVELCFNMRGKWNTFVKARAAWLAKDWETAARELLDSLWAEQVKGGRANRIAGYVRDGAYPNEQV